LSVIITNPEGKPLDFVFFSDVKKKHVRQAHTIKVFCRLGANDTTKNARTGFFYALNGLII